ncbi:MMPL family transporter [Methylocystis bryophila]|uniref:Hopanoid biosynthesis-associated RND transporter HpnN n=1 Tax=Methylocystis bryophila TaxID=655015 RepID=A0A1W6MWT7_9HYPH|nr:MMPL family transporter [Methylocystis bryophila]ARN82063.1 hopanoid biosynthesis-associated RND transporter HpnN [Methylocystis bryophila]BDV38187.1 RND transporter [Methylocystis bryophila]
MLQSTESAIVALVGACRRRPYLTIVVSLLVALLAGSYAYQNIAINTDTDQLISSKLPWRQHEIAFDAAFPQQDKTLLVVVDGATPELAESAAGRLAAALAKTQGRFQEVEELGAPSFFKQNGLLFLTVDELRRLTDQIIRAQPFLGALASDPTLRGLAGALRFVPEGARRDMIQLDDFATPVSSLSSAIDTLLAGRPAAFSWSELMTGTPSQARELRRFIRVRPVLDFDALQPGAAASETIRKTATELGYAPENGVSVRLTGPVAIADEEFGSLAEGATLNSVLTVAAVLLILWLALRSGRMIFAVMTSLFVGLAITSALGLAMVGALNLISVAFAVLFVGIGVDFGIQFAVRYRRERHENDDLDAALDATAAATAKPLLLAAAATAAGFYAFLPTQYIGVSELGLIAGTGMIIAYLTSVTLLPALLTVLKPPAEPKAIGFHWLAPVDRFMARHRKPILIFAALTVAAGAPLFLNLHFDYDPLNLRNTSSESISTLKDLMKDAATTPNAVNVLAPSLDQANALARRLSALPEVAETVTLQDFVPDDQDKKLAIIEDAQALLGPTLNAPDVKPAPSEDETRQALKEAAEDFLSLSGQARGEALASQVAKSLNALAEADPARRIAVERALLGGLELRLDQIRASLQAQRVTLGTLPPTLAREWTTQDGKARVEVRPKGEKQDNETLDRFTAAVLSVAPEATGGPILIQESARTIVRAFIQGATLALVSICLILLVALRRVVDMAVTIVPLLLAAVLTLELMVLFGLKLNFANIIALPLLLGVGVAFKIYYVLAWRQGETSFLASSLTRAALFSAMTTATAFASLWVSDHPGTSSMGKLLSLSLLTTLVAAVLFQPILMGPPRQATARAPASRTPSAAGVKEPADS